MTPILLSTEPEREPATTETKTVMSTVNGPPVRAVDRPVLQTIMGAVVLEIVVKSVVLSVGQAISVGVLMRLVSMEVPMLQSVVQTVVTAVTGLNRFRSAEHQSGDGNQSQCEPLHENPLS
ncbi:MAG: hypothetical protein IID45_16005 [Planctomycetes bacterium]|nr:hypothetical protein [Planctomycetota bacterium]